MAPASVMKAKGLYTSPNPISGVPDGAVVEARNCVIRSKDIYESRRGFTIPYLTGPGAVPEIFTFYKGAIYTHFASTIKSCVGGTWATVDTSSTAPDNDEQRLKFCEAQGNLYWVTTTGTKTIDSIGGVVRESGPRPPLSINAGLSGSPGEWFTPDNQVAYRAVFGFVDASGLVKLSAPSPRTVVINPAGGTDSVVLLDILVEQPQINGFLRLYRTELSGGEDIDPGDEMFLVYETEIEADNPGLVFSSFVTDVTPEALLGDPLYTNPNTGEGILQANNKPPIGHDLALWDGRLWWANTVDRHRFFVQLLGTGPSDGIQVGDTVTVGGITFTGHASTTSTTTFQVFTSGTPAENVQNTAFALLNAINSNNACTVFAYYGSGPDDVPGKLRFESRALSPTGFTVVTSRATAFNPFTLGDPQPSDNNALPHGLFFSKQEQPEAVPPINYLLVNTKAAPILRIKPLRDRLYVFKTDGTYVVSGAYPYRVDMLDDTAILVSPDSVVQANSQIYALTTQGMVAVADGGVRLVAMPIDTDLTGYRQAFVADNDFSELAAAKRFGRACFSVSYESERQVQLWLPTNTNIVNINPCDKEFIYSTLYDSWTEWDVVSRFGLVEPRVDRLWITGPNTQLMRVERKDLDFTDYVDRSELTISAISATDQFTLLVTMPGSSTAPPLPGDALTLVEGPPRGVITAVAPNGLNSWILTLSTPVAFLLNLFLPEEIGFERGIDCELKYTPMTMGQPSYSKRFQEATLHLANYGAHLSTITAIADMGSTEAEAEQDVVTAYDPLTSTDVRPFAAVQRRNARRLIPRDKQVGTQVLVGMAIREAFSTWELLGVSVEYEMISNRNSR